MPRKVLLLEDATFLKQSFWDNQAAERFRV